MTPTDTTNRYFACVRAKDLDALAALYAVDGVLILPDGREFAGVDAIIEVQRGVFAASSPQPKTSEPIVSGNVAAVQVAAHLPDGSVRRTANFFTLADDGRIQRLSIYRQG